MSLLKSVNVYAESSDSISAYSLNVISFVHQEDLDEDIRKNLQKPIIYELSKQGMKRTEEPTRREYE